MLELERKLMRKLNRMGVGIKVPDGDTAIFRGVPANAQFFSKEATNLLIKRPSSHMPFLVCVDEDLEYVGPDVALNRAFAGGVKREGWRVLSLAAAQQDDFQATVQGALTVLGSDGREPALALSGSAVRPANVKGLLSVYGANLSQQAPDGEVEPTVGREGRISEITSCVMRWGQARLALVVGESGVGKSNILQAVARKLSQTRNAPDLLSVDLAGPMSAALFDAEREGRLAALLDEAAESPNTVLAMEHLELALATPYGALLLAKFLDRGQALIGTTWPQHLEQFQRDPIAGRTHVVELPELTPAETVAVLAAYRKRIATHHHIEIGKPCIRACVRAAEPLAGYFPAKAITLLDGAAAVSALAGTKVLSLDDIYSAVGTFDTQ